MKNGSEIIETEFNDAALQFIRKLLLLCTAGLILFHMLLSSFNSAIPNRNAFRHADEWAGLVLLIGFLVYAIVWFCTATNRKELIKEIAENFSAYEYWYLFVVAFWYVLSCVVHQHMTGKNAFKANDWWLYITWLMSFAVFPFARIIGARKAKIYYDLILKIILIPHIIFFAWLLWNYFHANYVTFPSGNALQVAQGPGLAAGENRNFTGATAMSMIGLCWYMVFSQKSFRKIPYIFGIAVYLAVLILTNSRTSWYALLVMTALVVFHSVWFCFRKKDQIVRILVGVTCVAVCIVAMHFLRGGVFELWDRSVNYSGNYSPAAEVTAWEADTRGQVQAVALTGWAKSGSLIEDACITGEKSPVYCLVDLAEAKDYIRTTEQGLSGRKELYEACLKLMLSRKYIFLFGVTHADVGRAIQGMSGATHVNYSVHNFWLQMGAAFGVPMMLASIVFTLLLALRCLRVLFREKGPFAGSWTAAVLVLSILVFELAETEISAGSLVVCPAFYLFAGWVVAMDLEWKEQNKTELAESVPA